MAYNTKAIKRDTNEDAISQFFSVAADDYYALLGTANVGPHYIPFDTAGDELFTAANPGRVAVENPTGESLDVQVTGSIPEYLWVDGDAEPTPDFDRAIGVFINASHEMVVKYWDGTSWEDVA